MIAILNYFGKRTCIFGVANASVNDDGFFCELCDRDKNVEVIKRLTNEGFKAGTVGALLKIGVTGFTITPEQNEH